MGDASKNPKSLEAAVAELGAITGQQPVVTRAKKAIANFNLREGMPVGCSVTLRGARMFEFLDRFITIAVPRMRDFRGLPTDSFDGRGNYTIGIKEQMIFPEIDYDKVEKIHGMDITLVTSAGRDDTALALLRELGMPFRGEAEGRDRAAAPRQPLRPGLQGAGRWASRAAAALPQVSQRRPGDPRAAARLRAGPAPLRQGARDPPRQERPRDGDPLDAAGAHDGPRSAHRPHRRRAARAGLVGGRSHVEIGRASCRERV